MDSELQSDIMMLQNKFIDIYPSGATIYVGIFDDKLLNFRWSEFDDLATATQLQYPPELKTGNEAQRLRYFNSPEFKESEVFNRIKNSIDGKAVDIHNTDIFDFDIITNRGDDSGIPTQYAWKMGNNCEENTHGPKSHNIAAALCGDPITGKKFDAAVGGVLSDRVCTSKIDHAVHIKESFDTRVSELKLDNYQLLDDPLYDGSPPGTHPSDHSALCFDIICKTDLMTEYYGGKSRGLETNYASFYNLERSSTEEWLVDTTAPGPSIKPVTEIIDIICGTLISWNAEGFCGVLPFLLLEEALQGIPEEARRNFEAKIAEFNRNNSEDMDREVLIRKINDFYSSMRPLLAGTALATGLGYFSGGIIPAAVAVAGSAAFAAGADKFTGTIKPGGYWILNDWGEYIGRFYHKKCKILMIQELLLQDFLGMPEIRDHMDEIVQHIAGYIIKILSGDGDDMIKWRYQWDGYTGCVFWDSSVYELVDSLSIIRNKEAIRRVPLVQAELNHGGVWDHTKTKLNAGQSGDKFSTYFKFKLKVGESFLNVTNIHLKASGGDHVRELRNILDKIRINMEEDRPRDHYLIGDFNDKYIEKLMINTSVKSATRDGWYKMMGRSAVEAIFNKVASVGPARHLRGAGKKHKSTRIKRKSTRRKHKKTHKKSKRKKSYKKKGKTKRK